ncbi:MAG: type II secretion system F family protein [Marinosulfonomonas sp.]
MNEFISSLFEGASFGPQTILIMGIAVGAMLFFFGLSSALSERDPVVERMGRKTGGRRHADLETGILNPENVSPKGVLKAFIPSEQKELTEVQRQLAMAGHNGPNAVLNYYLLRVSLGILLPIALLAIIWAARTGLVSLPPVIDAHVAGWETNRVIQILMGIVAVGFFGPGLWLKSRVAERKRAISEHFPNALDLIQISVEAGLGFDAAMIRVGNELRMTSPAISQELLQAQREIQAGQSRDRALMAMANRTGVEEVTSFSNVVLQSMRFGTSVSETLTTYAKEMRTHRELKAQEKANRLPVQMSAVLAALMLPSLVLLTLGPTIIRYTRLFVE